MKSSLKVIKSILKITKIFFSIAGGIFLFFIIVNSIYLLSESRNGEDAEQENVSEVSIEVSGDLSMFQVDEDAIPDAKYYPTVQEAMLKSEIRVDKGEEYEKNMDHIITSFENSNYVVVCFSSYKGSDQICESLAKFKIKEINGKKKYAFISSSPNRYRRGGAYTDSVYDLVKKDLWGCDYAQDLNVALENARFAYGDIQKCRLEEGESIEAFRVEGQKPDGIIEHKHFGEVWYFWYFINLKSEKPGKELTYTLGVDKNE